jgi:hypothetical protein
LIERNIDLGMSDSSLLPIPAASITAWLHLCTMI